MATVALLERHFLNCASLEVEHSCCKVPNNLTHFLGLAKKYLQCTYGLLGREVIKYTFIYGICIRLWPTYALFCLQLLLGGSDLEHVVDLSEPGPDLKLLVDRSASEEF
jgi:hypothetical protein